MSQTYSDQSVASDMYVTSLTQPPHEGVTGRRTDRQVTGKSSLVCVCLRMQAQTVYGQ